MTPQELNKLLVDDCLPVASMLLPNGRKESGNWRVGSIGGEKGKSLSVSLSGKSIGVWSDFSTGESGDMLSLWQKVKGISFKDTINEVREYLNLSEPNFYKRNDKPKTIERPKDISKLSGKCKEWLTGRNIQEEIINRFKVVSASENVVVFPFISPQGELELIKYRDITNKKIWSIKDPQYHLWGWHAVDDNAREVILTEGEIDCMSYACQGYTALSIPQGAGSGNKQDAWIENDYDRLLRFETIYISMDMDEAGQSSVKHIVDRLGSERCKVIELGSFKDANEVHMECESLEPYVSSAKSMDPEELCQIVDYWYEIIEEFNPDHQEKGIKLPWPITYKTEEKALLRPAETTVWAGVNGHGKSISLSQILVDAMHQGYRTCLASMEMPPRKVGHKMVRQITDTKQPNQFQIDKSYELLDNSCWMFDLVGRAKTERLLSVFEYARKRYGIDLFVIDSLAKCGLAEDDYNGQKSFVEDIVEFAHKHNVHVVLVMHIRKGENEKKIPSKMDIKGTGGITDMVENVFIWWRNKEEDREFDAILNCEKQRETGDEPKFTFKFNTYSCRFYREEEPAINYTA